MANRIYNYIQGQEHQKDDCSSIVLFNLCFIRVSRHFSGQDIAEKLLVTKKLICSLAADLTRLQLFEVKRLSWKGAEMFHFKKSDPKKMSGVQ